jgi:hypothetical protein|tara:strand:+ start:1077 stop:1817 length:741 start_codon:yes stop_codon:yes gene_type:complete
MSKELPYYQFEVAEYLAGDIMICSLEAQGLYSIIKCLYWQKECKLNIRQIHKRFKDIDADVIQELIDEGCIKVDSTGEITITFLLSQYQTFKERREKLSKAGRKGGQSKKEASIKPPLNKDETTIKHIEENREEKKREEESKGKFTPEQFLKWFNESRTKLLDKPSNINYLSAESKSYLEILTSRYTGEDFNKALHNICNDQWANETNNIMPKHFLKPDEFSKYLDMAFVPLISKQSKLMKGWAIK